MKRYAEALLAAQRAVALNSEDSAYWHLLGYLKLNTDDPAGAIENFRTALEFRSGFSAARYNIAIAQAMLRRGPETLEALADALERDHNPDYAKDVVSELLNAGLKDEAERASRMINQSDPLERA